MASKVPTFSCLIDLQKAFDWVYRDLLFYKLLEYNIDGNMYKAVRALYSKPLSCVRLNEVNTEWFETTSGVKQGDYLSPTLFCIFINDLITEINGLGQGVKLGTSQLSILIFADDIALLAENEQDLQTMLNCVHSWCDKWRMAVNLDKTKVMHFRYKRKQITKYCFTYENSQIEIVNRYEYLGMLLDDHLDCSATAELLAGAAGRALGAVLTKFKNFRNNGFNTFQKLFDTSVSPILGYASEVWGYKDNVLCERVHQRASRYYLGVHPKTPLLALTGDMGWKTAQINRHIRMVRYWNRLLTLDDDRLTKKVF